MNLLPGLPALITYFFLYFSLTSCKPLETISEEKLQQELLGLKDGSYSSLLLSSIPVASSGKTFFKTQGSLSEDCIRTTKVIMQFLEKPSTMDMAGAFIADSVREALKDKRKSTFLSQIHTACKQLNELVKTGPFSFANFENLKKTVELPKPEKNYIMEISSGQNIEELIKNTLMHFEDPELIKFSIIMQLVKLRLKTVAKDESQRELICIAKATHDLAFKKSSESTVDNVFKNALDEFMKNLLAQSADKNAEFHATAFSKKLDEYFLNNGLLKEEYSKLKKEAMNNVSIKP